VRANLVKQDTLHQLAVELGLPAVLRLGEGEAAFRRQEAPLDPGRCLEAVIGAVYLDAGYIAAGAGARLFEAVEINPQMPAIGQGSQDRTCRSGCRAARCVCRSTAWWGRSGAAHQQTFDVECEIAELGLASAALAARAGPASRPPPRPCCRLESKGNDP
jgi:ribonuclease-3